MSDEKQIDDKKLSDISGGGEGETVGPGGGTHTSPDDPPVGGSPGPTKEPSGGGGGPGTFEED